MLNFTTYFSECPQNIQKVFNPPDEDKNFFGTDNGVWDKSTFKFGKTGDDIDYYSASLDCLPEAWRYCKE